MRSGSILTRTGSALAAGALVAGLLGIVAATSVAASLALSPLAANRVALAHVSVGGPNYAAPNHAAPNHVVGTYEPRVNGLAQVTSSNWAGYADTAKSGAVTTVSATFQEPTVKCVSKTDEELAAFWVGIDGYSSSTVEQDGTPAYCVDGAVSYYTWWEMYPSNDVQLAGGSVRPGDSVTSSVVRSGSSYTLKVTDATRSANSFTQRATCSTSTCKNDSVEWIAERPSESDGLYPLPNFGTWKETAASVTSGGTKGTISSFTDDAITMVNRANKKLATVGALSDGGADFTSTWKAEG